MRKRIFPLFAAALIGLTLPAQASVSASASPAAIQVYINGGKLAFPAGTPVMNNNTVLVPFRAVFEKLGLRVTWDAGTRTITGAGDSLTIRLTEGSTRAVVNGTVKKLPVAPSSANGTTYVPLRLIGEATGGKVLWHPGSRTVTIETPPSESESLAEIRKMMDRMTAYMNGKDLEGYLSLIHDPSAAEGIRDSMRELFGTYDFNFSIDTLELFGITSGEATVYTEETMRRTGGPYRPDFKDAYVYTLVRDKDGWKIAGMSQASSGTLLSRAQLAEASGLPAGERDEIRAALDLYYRAMNQRDEDAMVDTLNVEPQEIEAARDYYRQVFTGYNKEQVLEAALIYYYGNNEAAVHVTQTYSEPSDGVYRQELVFVLQRAEDGRWRISQTYLVDSSPIESTEGANPS